MERVMRVASVIEMHDVSWRRGEQLILDGIEWHVAAGEHSAILGLNGSGKTTLMNMVNGYIWPTTGTVSGWGSVWPRGHTGIAQANRMGQLGAARAVFRAIKRKTLSSVASTLPSDCTSRRRKKMSSRPGI